MEGCLDRAIVLALIGVVLLLVVFGLVLSAHWTPADTDRFMDRGFDWLNLATVVAGLVGVAVVVGVLAVAWQRIKLRDTAAAKPASPADYPGPGWRPYQVMDERDAWRTRRERANALLAEERLLGRLSTAESASGQQMLAGTQGLWGTQAGLGAWEAADDVSAMDVWTGGEG